jgi:hypothetical protein
MRAEEKILSSFMDENRIILEKISTPATEINIASIRTVALLLKEYFTIW